ncbi:MAG: hypothetical protein ACAI44_07965 [Candidatus Sericytochromatia bacterium]
MAYGLWPDMLKLLLGLMLAAGSAEGVQAPTLDRILQQGALESLPFPVLLPRQLPAGFELLDVRLHTLPHAQMGWIQSYTLVFASADQCFMLQSRPDGYKLPDSHCPGQQLKASRPFFPPAWSIEPQTLFLISPACTLTGQPLSKAAISAAAAGEIWQELGWYLPLALRQHPPRLPEIRESW